MRSYYNWIKKHICKVDENMQRMKTDISSGVINGFSVICAKREVPDKFRKSRLEPAGSGL
jgi:hypothetical protein